MDFFQMVGRTKVWFILTLSRRLWIVFNKTYVSLGFIHCKLQMSYKLCCQSPEEDYIYLLDK